MKTISITINGAPQTSEVEPRLLLVYYLREKLGLTGAHIGCDTTSDRLGRISEGLVFG